MQYIVSNYEIYAKKSNNNILNLIQLLIKHGAKENGQETYDLICLLNLEILKFLN